MFEFLFILLLIVIIIIGGYCACKLNESYSLIIRLIILSPSLAALYSLWHMVEGHCYVDHTSILFLFAISMLYGLFANQLSQHPVLKIHDSILG